MTRRILWLVTLLLALALGISCGDDGAGSDGDGDGNGSASDGGVDIDGGDGDGNSTASGNMDGGPGDAGGGGDVDGAGPNLLSEEAGAGEWCGAEFCELPRCCADPFVSTCGLALGERGCILPPPTDVDSDERCPPLEGGGFSFPSCCIEGECGINVVQVGFDACIELGQFKMLAEMMSGMEIDVPDPQSCD